LQKTRNTSPDEITLVSAGGGSEKEEQRQAKKDLAASPASPAPSPAPKSLGGMQPYLVSFFSFFQPLPFHSIYSGERRNALEQDWSRAHLPLSLSAALNAVFVFGLVAGLLCFAFYGIFSSDWATAILVFCIVFALSLALGFYIPSFASRRFARAAESDLPLALRSLSVYLSIKMPLEKAIAKLAEEGYASAPLWRMMAQSIEAGESVPSAIASSASMVSSMPFARAASALINYYEEGGSPEPLVALADELGFQQLSSIREESAKAGVGGLLFVAISSILPAFVLVLMVAAGPLIGLPSSPTLVWVLFIFILPFANAFVLVALLASAPVLGGTWRPEALSKAVSQKLSSIGLSGFGWKQAFFVSIFISFIAILISFIFPSDPIILRLGLVVALAPFLLISFFEGQVLSQVSALEIELPSLLLGAAASGRFSLERLLEQARNMPAGPLRDQAQAAARQIKAGANPLTVLSEWAANTPSIMLSRALTLLSVGWKAGGSMSKPLRALAADALASGALVRERAAQLATQRYTLWAAAGLLVPAILAVSLSFSSQVASIGVVNLTQATPSSSSAQKVIDNSSQASQALLSPQMKSVQAAAASVPLYLLLNSVIVGLYLAIVSGARERFVPYAAILIICSQLVWMLAGG
jgi:pilus assembly protein TadC